MRYAEGSSLLLGWTSWHRYQRPRTLALHPGRPLGQLAERPRRSLLPLGEQAPVLLAALDLLNKCLPHLLSPSGGSVELSVSSFNTLYQTPLLIILHRYPVTFQRRHPREKGLQRSFDIHQTNHLATFAQPRLTQRSGALLSPTQLFSL